MPIVTRPVRELAADQVIDRAATLDDVRAEVLAPERLNAIVFRGFAAVAPVIVSAAVLLVAAIIGSLLPAARAARVDVVQALRAE